MYIVHIKLFIPSYVIKSVCEGMLCSY